MISFLGRLKSVTRVEVKVQGQVLAMFSERGLPSSHTEHEILSLSQVLHSGNSDFDQGELLPFSFDLPQEIVVGNDLFALPPTAKWYHMNMMAEVTYKVIVDVHKKGIGRHDQSVLSTMLSASETNFLFSFEREILYLPKTRSVKVMPFSWGLTPHDAKREYIDMTNWSHMPLKPTWKKGVLLPQQSPVVAELRLPSCFFSGYPPLSFYIHLEFNPSSSFVFNLSQYKVNVQLVRQVSIMVNGRVNTMETAVGQTTIYTERSTATCRDIYGKIGFGCEGQETSWCVGNIVKVMHAAKVEIRPVEGDETRLPSFVHRQRVWMNTDDWADNAPEREGPALGLLSTAMGLTPSTSRPH